MKLLTTVVRLFMGAVFIFSGFVKLVDPIGTAIKMKEYFEVFSADFSPFFANFIPLSLPFGLLTIIVELSLGVMLLLKVRPKFTIWLLLAINVFFLFLVWYSAYFNKVTDCGCFGDAIKFSPWGTFYKDVVLTVLALFLLVRKNTISPFFSFKTDLIIIALTVVAQLALAGHALYHLPPIDFRPYHIGANIQQKMQYSGKPIYTYIMEKDGVKTEFEKYPTDTTYKFIEMKLQNPEVMPKITDFSIWSDEGTYTNEAFEGVKLFVTITDARLASTRNAKKIKELIDQIEAKHKQEITTWIVTSSEREPLENYRHEHQWAAPYYFIDKTVLEAMIRADPGIMLLKNGTVLGKWSHNDTPSLQTILNLIK